MLGLIFRCGQSGERSEQQSSRKGIGGFRHGVRRVSIRLCLRSGSIGNRASWVARTEGQSSISPELHFSLLMLPSPA